MVVVREGEMNWEGEVESALQQSGLQEAKQSHIINDVPFSTSATPSSLSLLGRQSSIYSLTLDEFQHSLCESGKNFGSMNMDEFLSSIWNAEENQQQQQQQQAATNNNTNNHNNLSLTKQPSLNRQTSLSIPAPLCRKTVDQVWSEIHKQQQQNNNNNNNNNVVRNTECATRQPTFGEMTLEDFLVKAGVVRETVAPSHQQQQQRHYAVYNPSNNSTMAPGAAAAPFVIGGGGGGNVVTVGDPSGSGYAGNGGNKRDGLGTGYPVPAAVAAGVCHGGGRVVNGGGGGGGYGVAVAPVTMGIGRPLSPVSSDGMGNENSGGGQFGLDMSGFRGRKRIVDGPVERVVERRQRRMIKNRESAARSRARKQAYTVELEAELNQLREENAQLKQALAELERRRRQQCLEEVNVRVQTKAQKAKEKLRALRRNMSCPL